MSVLFAARCFIHVPRYLKRDLQIGMHKDLETEVAIPIRLNRYTERKTICRVDGDRKNKKKNCIK